MRLIPVMLAVVIFAFQANSKETWRGLVVAPECRCSDYASDDYRYPQSVEHEIVEAMGGRIYGPYTGTCFTSTQETDIEHIVARSEAHDSGLCSADADTKRNFAHDLLNLTLASPSVNRHQKSGKDASDWLPGLNQCWFAERIVQVRAKYGLTIDQREADALESVLSACESTAMVLTDCAASHQALDFRKNSHCVSLLDSNSSLFNDMMKALSSIGYAQASLAGAVFTRPRTAKQGP